MENKGGLATRAVRVVILSVGLVFAKGASIFDVDLLAPAYPQWEPDAIYAALRPG